MRPTHQASRYMERTTLIACAVAVAVFVRVELEALVRRAWHRIAWAWMQCDEVAP